MFRMLNQLRRAFWNGFRHGIFMNAKGAAYSSILTVFPALIVVAWVLNQTGMTATFLKEISNALGTVLPPGSRGTALAYFNSNHPRPLKEIYSASTVMVLAASGVMISWMTGFRAAHGISKNPWGFWRERGVALFLVVLGFAPMMIAMSMVAFGNQIEAYLQNKIWVPKFYLLLLWSLFRWIIAAATSITSIMLIYHWGLPRIQKWTKCLPGHPGVRCLRDPICPVQRDLWATRRRYRTARLALSGLHLRFGWRRVQRAGVPSNEVGIRAERGRSAERAAPPCGLVAQGLH
jgi:membrane protein